MHLLKEVIYEDILIERVLGLLRERYDLDMHKMHKQQLESPKKDDEDHGSLSDLGFPYQYEQP